MLKKLLSTILAVVLFVALVLVGPVVTGCHQCKSGTMRCAGNKVQLCAPNHRWKTVVDCGKLKRTEKKHACVKISEDRRSCRAKATQ